METKKNFMRYPKRLVNQQFVTKKPKYRLVKLTVGVVSCLVGWTIWLGPSSMANAAEFQPSSMMNPTTQSVAESVYTSETGSKMTIKDAPVNEVAIQVVEATKQILQSIDYDSDETIANMLAPQRYTLADKVNKRLEISRQTGRNFIEVSEEEALAALKKENVQILPYGDSFNQVQNDIETIVSRLVANSSIPEWYSGDASQYYIDKIVNNKEKLLLGLSYIDRLYDIQFGEHNLKDILTYQPSKYGKNVDPIDWLIRIGSSSGEDLKLINNTKMFHKLFAGTITNDNSLIDFLESNRQLFAPDQSMDEWFKESSKAFIVEGRSEVNNNVNVGLYTKLASEELTRSYILPLLAVSENSIYVISNSASITYGLVDTYVNRDLKETNPDLYKQKIEEFKLKLDNVSKSQSEFIDFWYRVAKPEVQGLLSGNRYVIDTYRLYGDDTYYNPANEWSPKSGERASIGVKEFFAPLNMYGTFIFADGQAEGNGMRLFLAKALDDRGLSTYTHEMTHLLDRSVWLNNYGKRDGLEVEFYARGLYETDYTKDLILNLNLIFDHQGDGGYSNTSPDRFQSEADIQQYMKGLFDVLYTLDYAEASAVLTKDDATKQKWFHKLEQVDDTKKRANQGNGNYTHKKDKFTDISLDEAGKLTDINSLIEQNILASRYEFKGRDTIGEAASNGYYVVPMFSPIYAAPQNNTGVSGDIITKRLTYELLAEYGYYGGLVPYLSNQYKNEAVSDNKVLSDEYILGKISNGTYTNMAEFKKAMFDERIENKDYLSPITIDWKGQPTTIDGFETLMQLMNQAIEADLAYLDRKTAGYYGIMPKDTEVEKLKAAIFNAYMSSTNEFRTSIYTSVPTEEADAEVSNQISAEEEQSEALIIYATEEEQAEASIQFIKDAIKEALMNSAVDRSEFEGVYISNPKIEDYASSDMEMKVIELVEDALAGKVSGIYSLYLLNSKGATIDELLEKNLVISYQVKEGADYYTYSNGEIFH